VPKIGGCGILKIIFIDGNMIVRSFQAIIALMNDDFENN